MGQGSANDHNWLVENVRPRDLVKASIGAADFVIDFHQNVGCSHLVKTLSGFTLGSLLKNTLGRDTVNQLSAFFDLKYK